jgi:two-component sensor histidine kinase
MRDRFLLQLLLLSRCRWARCWCSRCSSAAATGAPCRWAARRAQREARRAGRGQLAIAHEVKNSLNGLNAAVSLLAQGADPALPTAALKGQVDRLRHLASSLAPLRPPGEVRRGSSDLRRLLQEAVEGLQVLPEAADVQVWLEPGRRSAAPATRCCWPPP